MSLVLHKSDGLNSILMGKAQKYYYDFYPPMHCLSMNKVKYFAWRERIFLFSYDLDFAYGHGLRPIISRDFEVGFGKGLQGRIPVLHL
jgi:hypothetical protein